MAPNKILLALITATLLSCIQPPTPDKSLYEQPIQPTIEDITIQEESDFPQEETMAELKVKAIPAYDRYASYEPSTGYTTVWGIDSDELEQVSLESAGGDALRFLDFMVVDGVVYFQVQSSMTTKDEETGEEQTIPVVHYYSQEGSTVTEIEPADYPDKPERVRVSYDGDLFKVVSTEYNGKTYSYVYQGPLCCAYAVIDSYALKNEGLWFSVSEGMNLRPAGIYFFRKGEGRITEVCDGRIW